MKDKRLSGFSIPNLVLLVSTFVGGTSWLIGYFNMQSSKITTIEQKLVHLQEDIVEWRQETQQDITQIRHESEQSRDEQNKQFDRLFNSIDKYKSSYKKASLLTLALKDEVKS